MSCPRYKGYKDSGVEWLGAVPEHWGVVKLGRALRQPPCYGVLVPDFDPDGVPMLRITDMEKGVADRARLTTITKALSSQYSRTVVQSGDVVISVVGTIGETMIITDHLAGVNLSRAVARLQVTSALSAAFACWLFQSLQFRRYIDLVCVGTAQRVLNMADLSAFRAVLPPPEEQTAIAAFLDRQTAKIDALVDEQERLIELLTEKRQAVISHAVTKGLDPNAPMKDSGVEWLGEVPQHWAVERIKRVARMESGHTPDKKIQAYWTDCDIPWVSLHDTAYLKENDYISETAFNVNELGIANSSARLLPAGAVVFSRDATIGRCAITTRPMAVSQHFIAWLCGERILPEYLLLALRSMVHELERLTFGATIKTIGMPDVRKLWTAVPPLEEQRCIVDYARKQTTCIDALTQEAEGAVRLLKERRSALISAAVTGKIDVRGVVSPERGRHQEHPVHLPIQPDRRPNAVAVDLVAEPA